MYKFNSLFHKSPGISAPYNGQIIYLYDHVHFNEKDILRIKILSTNSPHKQGISMHVIEPKHKKYMLINNRKLEGFTLWETSFPKEGAEIYILKDIKVAIWNAWEEEYESGRKKVWSALKNAAMKIEIKDNKRIYYCNDGDDDEDFDDLIFEIEIQKTENKNI